MASKNNPTSPARLRLSTRRILFATAFLALILVAMMLFLRVGTWLVVEDSLTRARAIVVLSGAMPLRAMEAAKLYREGYATEVWLTHSTEPGATLEKMGIPFSGEDSYNILVLIHEGVPLNAIRVLEPPIVNTADEVRTAAGALSRANGAAVIVVTSKAHTRRVRLLWHRLAPAELKAIVRASTSDPFDPRHWWRNTGDALDVVRELLGLMNAWAGLPVHPAR